MKHPSIVVAGLFLALAACSEASSPLGPDATESASFSQGAAPTDISTPATLDPFASAVCGFPVLAETTGKQKVLELPGGRTLIVSPALSITWINGTTGRSVTRSQTGAFRFNPLPNGGFEIVLTGNNSAVLNDEVFVFLSGRFTVVFGPDGSLVQGFEGVGRTVDACAVLAA